MYKRSSLGVYLPLTRVTVGLTGETIYRAPVADCTRKINSPPVLHSDVLQNSSKTRFIDAKSIVFLMTIH